MTQSNDDPSNPGHDDALAPWAPEDMLEITLNEPDDFLKVRETLTRIGVASKRDANTLWQSCYLLHKQGHYVILHFKELFMLDGKPSNFSVDDLGRRNTIAQLLSDWGLLTIVDPSKMTVKATLKNIKVVAYKDKVNWNLLSKYTIGKVKKTKS
jgi:hypothetical protein